MKSRLKSCALLPLLRRWFKWRRHWGTQPMSIPTVLYLSSPNSTHAVLWCFSPYYFCTKQCENQVYTYRISLIIFHIQEKCIHIQLPEEKDWATQHAAAAVAQSCSEGNPSIIQFNPWLAAAALVQPALHLMTLAAVAAAGWSMGWSIDVAHLIIGPNRICKSFSILKHYYESRKTLSL